MTEKNVDTGAKGRAVFFAQFTSREELAEHMREVRQKQTLYARVGKAVVEAYEKAMNVQEGEPMGR